MSKFEMLGVYIEAAGEKVRVGSLLRDTGGLVRFDIDESYIEMGEYRPILSSSLLRIGDEEYTRNLLRNAQMLKGGRDVHPWFTNLLPEGALKELVLRGMPTGSTTDFDVLKWVGHDLPGAVSVIAEDGSRTAPPITDETTEKHGIRFSLAGVQLKFSMQKAQGERLTLPATGVNGDIIAKLPSVKYRNLPEVEFSSMTLAAAVGVTVPEFNLVPTSSVLGLSDEVLEGGDQVLAVTRFDRRPDGTRVHMEDFLQVLGDPTDRKYTAANDETVLKIATRLGGGGTVPFLQAARRIAANILMGNTDAHLKNWSLWYPKPHEGQLSPAYDVVASYVYDRRHDMALRFRGTHNSRIMDLARFQRAAEFCEVPVARVRKEIKLVVEKAADEWKSMLQDLPMPEDFAEALVERTKSLALVDELGVDFDQSQNFARNMR
jgi:serine/threonine-protein kinase HipA